MTKRKINQQQQRRIASKQAELLDTDALPGTIIAHYGQDLEIEGSDGQTVVCKKRQNLGPLVAGDHIKWLPENNSQQGVVVALEQRDNLLSRPDARGNLHAVAANIDQMYIVIAPVPAPNQTTIDRYLLAAEHQNIEPIIILNKEDLLPEDPKHAELLAFLHIYQAIGVKTLIVSAKKLQHLSQLHESMRGKICVFVGQSGVGKSSLIATLLPHHNIKIGEISTNKKLGKHTTTTARLYRIEGLQAAIIDSPGMREFPLWQLDPATLAYGFVEFRPYLQDCKFRNCMHNNEPGCGLIMAVADGKISEARLASYQKIHHDMHPKTSR